MSDRLEWFKRELKALSSGPKEQLQYLEQQGLAERIDELALDYDAIAMATGDMLLKGEITQPVRECAMELLDYLKSFSGEASAHLWTPDALRSAPEWERVRRMATECLAQLQ